MIGRIIQRPWQAGLMGLLLAVAGLAAAASPAWEALTPAQRQALAPLQKDWPSIDATRKEKWLEMASRFPSMTTDERRRLQARMSEWARMTPEERTRARLQFQETRQLPADEKQARWEAYQALTEEERKSLAQRAAPPARGSAPVTAGASAAAAGDGGTAKNNLVVPGPAPRSRPVSPALLNARPGATTTTVATPAAPPAHHQPGLPKIAATPTFVDQATLLPKRGPQGAAVRSAASAPAARP